MWIYDRAAGLWKSGSQTKPGGGAGTENPLFRGDYRTNNFSQWPGVQNKLWNSTGSGYDGLPPGYPATIYDDAHNSGGKAALFEVRDGDIAVGSERSEVVGDSSTGGTEGQSRWYKFATKFDATFPNNHITYDSGNGWGVVNQWHATGGSGQPPITLGFRPWSVNGAPYTATPTGYWSITYAKMDSSFTVLFQDAIMHIPMNIGSWNDIKMHVVWSGSDATGSIELWHNGVKQSFLTGGTVFNMRTMVPGDSYTYYKEGYYRNQNLTWTAKVHHTGFLCAATEADLG